MSAIVEPATETSTYGTAPPKTSVNKPILSCDFDGVIHSYTTGWHGADVVADGPVDGAMRFLTDASDKFEINIYSSRSGQPGGVAAMYDYIAEHLRRYWVDMPAVGDKVLSKLKFPTDKPSAMVMLDDRAVTFTGVFPEVDDLLDFKPWNKR
jgi:hypothetical protein